jgi:GWxTD domain-containing protein
MKLRHICVALAMAVLCATNWSQDVAGATYGVPDEYQRWIDEDVKYIASPQERSDFLKLASKPERDRFVEQFWKRRDRTPNTAENKFKEEHYRRIAYSNVHFRDRRAGWQTDRGRTYIVYGPPTSMKRSNDAEHTREIWRYDTTLSAERARVFVFADECDCGELKLSPEE